MMSKPLAFAYCNSSASCERLRKCGVVDYSRGKHSTRYRSEREREHRNTAALVVASAGWTVHVQLPTRFGSLLSQYATFCGSIANYANWI